uniref:Aminopeptidase n=2 Tax=Caenorhabditis japonica TaxID=281687 RepID=A0A8R1HRZ1_CAEJA
MLDHFENVSLVFNGNELEIFNVLLTDYSMEVSVDQPVLFPGSYTLTAHRYKGLIGSAIYYRDAGEHAVFASQLFPNRAPALFPTYLGATEKATFSVSMVHPIGTLALSSAASEGAARKVDTNWQKTSFSTTPAITPAMLCFLLLPAEYTQIDSTYTGINISVHFNKYRVQKEQAKHLLHTATQVLALLKDIFSSLLPVPKIDIVTMHDATSASCFGALVVSEAQFFAADYANQVRMLATWLTKQWIGGYAAISDGGELCLQEDLATFIAAKIIKRMTNDEYTRLSHLAKIYLSETVFSPGETLKLDEYPNELEISEKCGLKGALMLESIEVLIGEKQMLAKINEVVYNSKRGSYNSDTLYGLLNSTVDSDIFVSQLLHFWREHGGLPFMNVDRLGNSIKINQNGSNLTVKNGVGTWERMPLWPLPLQFTEFKLPIQIMLSQGIHLSPVREGLIFSNLGFSHFYRVNYDLDTWREIKTVLTENATSYTMRERFQLVSDFCYFYASKSLAEPAASVLRNEFVQLVRLRPVSFPLCDAAIFQCVVTHEHSRPKFLDKSSMIQLRRRVFESFSNSSEMECRAGLAHDALNDLCTKLYGVSCL